MDDYSIKKYFGGCPHDCPDTCAMIYEVSDKKLVSVKGNSEHQMTGGVLCVKLKDYENGLLGGIIMSGINPVYSLPETMDFKSLLSKIDFSVNFSISWPKVRYMLQKRLTSEISK